MVLDYIVYSIKLSWGPSSVFNLVILHLVRGTKTFSVLFPVIHTALNICLFQLVAAQKVITIANYNLVIYDDWR